MKTAVIVGRFQVPELHEGHRFLIDTAFKECEDVVIFVGASKILSERNPMPSEMVINMVQTAYPKANLKLIIDRGDDKIWSNALDRWLEEIENPIMYGSRDSFLSHYVGKYAMKYVESPVAKVSGTLLRQKAKPTNLTDYNLGFIRGVEYALKKLKTTEEDASSELH